MENKKPTFKMRPLFSYMEEPKVKDEPRPEEEETNIVKQSEVDGWVSVYQPNDNTDRFVVISPKKERFAAKFYNKVTDDFIGSSMLGMYNCKDHFDRSIIPDEEGVINVK